MNVLDESGPMQHFRLWGDSNPSRCYLAVGIDEQGKSFGEFQGTYLDLALILSNINLGPDFDVDMALAAALEARRMMKRAQEREKSRMKKKARKGGGCGS